MPHPERTAEEVLAGFMPGRTPTVRLGVARIALSELRDAGYAVTPKPQPPCPIDGCSWCGAGFGDACQHEDPCPSWEDFKAREDADYAAKALSTQPCPTDAVVRAARALSDCAAEFDGDLRYCGERLDALWTAVDGMKRADALRWACEAGALLEGAAWEGAAWEG